MVAAVATALLAILWVALLIYGFLRNSYTPVLLVSICNVLVNSRIMKRLATSVAAVEAATSDLGLLIEVLKILEQEPFESPRLVHLQSALQVDGIAPSAAMRKLDRIVHYLEQRRNNLLTWFGLDRFLIYTPQWMFRVESWRREFGPAIRGWLAAVGELEVLAALSGYAFEHPGDAWPEFDAECACFEAESLAHPLLPAGKAVRNDLKLCDGLQLIVLSGPNMSGKSTFVRGIGVNAVLAQCGAPVRAKRLRMSRLAVGASICVLDSLAGWGFPVLRRDQASQVDFGRCGRSDSRVVPSGRIAFGNELARSLGRNAVGGRIPSAAWGYWHGDDSRPSARPNSGEHEWECQKFSFRRSPGEWRTRI